MSENNIILMTDSYKVSHWKQYPPGTQYVYSYLESRGGEFDYSVFFGLKYIIQKYLSKPITLDDILEAKEYFGKHFNDPNIFNINGWLDLLNDTGGYLPVEICAVKEGSKIPVSNVLMTIRNTRQKYYWMTNYLETLLMQVWYPTTVCTQSHYMKQIILKYLKETGTPESIDFKLHDFGFRGSTSLESSALGGAAHLVNFKGTDTFSAIKLLNDYYGESMAGYSIPAAEHSTITSWGENNEVMAYQNMLNSYPNGLVAVVSDSYDIYNACEYLWGHDLKNQVMRRNGTLIIRPDSGDPVQVILKCLNILADRFGANINSKGYKVLDDHVRLIQGDGIDRISIEEILKNMKINGWSADNIAFGSGGGLLQKVNRDTMKFAIKCSAISINNQWQDVYKNPITDPGKKSKSGILHLIKNCNGDYETVNKLDSIYDDLLDSVYFEGRMYNMDESFDNIRYRANG